MRERGEEGSERERFESGKEENKESGTKPSKN